MTRLERAYVKKIKDLIDRVGKLQDGEIRRVLDLLDQARREVGDRVATSDWQAHHLPQLKDAVGRALENFRWRYQADLNSALGNMWDAGIDMVDGPLSSIGISALAPEISRAALEILQGYSADLIRGLTEDALKKVNNELTMGILGGKTPWEVMQAIGKNLEDAGVFGKIATRAETITRTEMARVHSSARQARQQKVMEAHPELHWKKQWISSGKYHPRPHHAALNGKVVDVNENFSGGIPYPHAPGLPASESINCGCSHVLTLADWEQLPKGREPVAYHERAIYD